MTTLAETKFRFGEQDNIRVPKLTRLLEHLIAAEEITLDDAIAAIAALTPAADRYIYFTSATAASLGTITAFARTILDDADAAAVRTTIGAQPLDSTLTALAAYNTNGILVQTAADTFAGRTLTAPAAGITVSDGNGVAGNPTLALANDLAALEALSGTNTIYYRSGADTWTAVTIGGLLSFSGGTLNVVSNPSFTGSVQLGDATTDNHGITGSLTLDTGTAAGILGKVSGVTTWALFGSSSTVSLYADTILLRTLGGTIVATVSSTGMDVVGEVRGDTLRIDETETVAAVATDRWIPINVNGTVRKLLLAS